MPTFEHINGKAIWVPAHAVLRVEQGEGGLSSTLHMIAPPGSPPGATLTAEVKGRVQVIGEQLDAQLAGRDERSAVVAA